MPIALECDGALSDAVLQAARAAILAHVDGLIQLPDSGELNRPLLPLLVALLDSAQTVARAVADNAWDASRPIDRALSSELARQAQSIAADIANAVDCPDARSWQQPAVTAS